MNTDTTGDATLIALLSIREKIANCRRQQHGDHYLTIDTLRQKARDVAAAFADPAWQTEQDEEPKI